MIDSPAQEWGWTPQQAGGAAAARLAAAAAAKAAQQCAQSFAKPGTLVVQQAGHRPRRHARVPSRARGAALHACTPSWKHRRRRAARPTWLQRPVVAHAAAVVRVQPQPVPHCRGKGWGSLAWGLEWTGRLAYGASCAPSCGASVRQQRALMAMAARHARPRRCSCCGQSRLPHATRLLPGRPTRVRVEAAVAALHDVGGAPPWQNA